MLEEEEAEEEVEDSHHVEVWADEKEEDGGITIPIILIIVFTKWIPFNGTKDNRPQFFLPDCHILH